LLVTIARCDHTSVGLLVFDASSLLLIERRKPPFGFAPPAGHVDAHGSYEQAASAELYEEVGLSAVDLDEVLEVTLDNPCRRDDGTWHLWKVYTASVDAQPVREAPDEVRSHVWASTDRLTELAARTAMYSDGRLSDGSWRRAPGLEPVWVELLSLIESSGKI
jgi:ADP-ribose pyrophosphatase YjhB (NUDIX family)